MATKQRIVYGASVDWGTDGSTFASIPECKAIAVPEEVVEYLDATHLQSPNGFREHIPGLKDAGELTIPCGYSTAGYNTAQGYRTNGTLVYFRTTMPLETGQTGGDVFEFTGYVSPQLETNGVGDIIAMNLIVRTSGGVDFTEGATA